MNAIAQVSAAPSTGPKLDNRRVLAGVVDLLIVTAGALVILYAGDSLSGDRQGALGAVILGWALYYYFALESGSGQTVGKKLMKLRVVCADGGPAGMREIAVRTVLRVVDGVGAYIVGLIVMLVTGQKRQRIGDLAAGTIVVDASAPATAMMEPAATGVETDTRAHDAEVHEEPVNMAPDPTRTITLPSRPEPPEPLTDPAEPAAEEAPAEHVAEVAEEAAPVLETEPVAEEPVVEVDEPVVETEPIVEVDEPVAEEESLPSAMSPSLEGLAADGAATQSVPVPVVERPVDEPVEEPVDETVEEPVDEHVTEPVDEPVEEPVDEAAESDEPVNVKSVETVSAMDLIMGAAEEDSAESDEDDAPASA